MKVPPTGHVAGALANSDARAGVDSALTELVIEGLTSRATGVGGSVETDFDEHQRNRLRRRGVNVLTAKDKRSAATVATAISTALDAHPGLPTFGVENQANVSIGDTNEPPTATLGWRDLQLAGAW